MCVWCANQSDLYELIIIISLNFIENDSAFTERVKFKSVQHPAWNCPGVAFDKRFTNFTLVKFMKSCVVFDKLL